MRALENKIPPPIVMVLFMCLMWVVSQLGFTIELNELVRTALIGLLLFFGIYLDLGGLINFKKAATTINPLKPENASALVISGVYQLTRNPMYLGLLLFLLAWAIYLCTVLAFCCIPFFILYINRFQILPEERALKKIFGTEFESYQSRVRRWL